MRWTVASTSASAREQVRNTMLDIRRNQPVDAHTPGADSQTFR